MIEITSLSAIEHVLEHRPKRIRSLSVKETEDPGRVQAIIQLARKHQIPCHVADPHQGSPVKATLLPFTFQDFKQLKASLAEKPKCLLLALDHIQDPQNYGALIRSADGLGAQAVIVPKDRSAPVTAAVYHASAGAVETVPLYQVTNLGEGLRQLKKEGVWIIGSSLSSETHSLDETPDFEKMVLVMGAEGEGLGKQIESLCDWLVRIPMLGNVQSLNVSASGAILMYALGLKQSSSSQKSSPASETKSH